VTWVAVSVVLKLFSNIMLGIGVCTVARMVVAFGDQKVLACGQEMQEICSDVGDHGHVVYCDGGTGYCHGSHSS
jgi:hypothetical protein